MTGRIERSGRAASRTAAGRLSRATGSFTRSEPSRPAYSNGRSHCLMGDSQSGASLTHRDRYLQEAWIAAGVAIMRDDLTAVELRVGAAKAGDGGLARRMLALALVVEGASRKAAAETCGMDRQTLREWVHRYNSRVEQPQVAGAPALADSGSEGRTRGAGGTRSRSPAGRCGALAAQGSAAPDRGDVRGRHAGAHGGCATGRARFRASVAAAPSPEGRRGDSSRVQKTSPAR